MQVGFMQGRFSPVVDGRIQRFPTETWRSEFSLANKASFRLMEWTLDQEGLHCNPLLNEVGRSDIRRLCERYGIRIPSVTGDCFMQEPFWKTSNSKIREGLLSDFRDVIRSCRDLGIRYIVVPLVDEGSLKTDIQVADLKTGLSELFPFLAESNVSIAFESDYCPDELHSFIQDFPPELCGINYDIGNSAGMGFIPSEEFAQYGRRVTNVHVKDRPRGGSTVPLGEGDADFLAVFRALADIGYSGNLILQTARDIDADHYGALVRYREFIANYVNFDE